MTKTRPAKKKAEDKSFQVKGSTSAKTYGRNNLGVLKEQKESQAVLESNAGSKKENRGQIMEVMEVLISHAVIEFLFLVAIGRTDLNGAIKKTNKTLLAAVL